MDVFGITYLIENAQQFWSELEDILRIPSDLNLSQLDAVLRQFVSLCASYHEQYLQSPLQLEHSCDLLLASELFTFHSERMCELLLDDTQKCTDPHAQLILYSILLAFGRQSTAFLRSQKKWQPLLPLLMDYVWLDIDMNIDDAYINGSGSGSISGSYKGISIPIEAKLRLLSVQILYEVCRVQKLSFHDLRVFDDAFIEHLFELVEQTRDHPDETFNYSVIKLIVALNEQFMVASLQSQSNTPVHATFPKDGEGKKPEDQNRVLRVLMARIGSSMTFGENMIFMLNRARRTPEDLVMQLLVLKILYLLFTTKSTCEYFYTNDLRVLVDVFIREIVNLDEENESLRHTYLRVLHPLLTKTQLQSMPYKRPQIVHVLESLIEHENIRDINPTTKRLVQRCLSGDWCVPFRKLAQAKLKPEREFRTDSPSVDAISVSSHTSAPADSKDLLSATPQADRSSTKHKGLKSSRSAENLNAQPRQHKHRHHLGENLRAGSNDSSMSLSRVAEASAVPPIMRRRERAGSVEVERHATGHHVLDDSVPLTQEPPDIRVVSPISPSPSDLSDAMSIKSLPASTGGKSHRRPAPPPPKRRKPPAIPPARSNSGAAVTITTIASSSSPLTLSGGALRTF